MDQDSLKLDMIDIAGQFTKDPVTEDTVLGDVLTDTGVVDGNNTALDFRLGVQSVIKEYNGQVEQWPGDWLQMTIKTLATRILPLVIFLLAFFGSFGQLVVNIGAGTNDAKKDLVTFGVQYLRSLDSVFGGKENVKFGKNSIFLVSPAFQIQSGTDDALNLINAKITGEFLTYETTKGTSGHTIPNFAKPFSSFPFSAGIETNDQFQFLNSVLEVGFVPVFIGRDNPEVLRHTHLGIYLQGGYKFKLDSNAVYNPGGDKDQSEELVNTGILRAKGHLDIDTRTLIQFGLVKLGLVGSVDGWFDIANGAIYHRIDGILRVYLSNSQTIDFVYQHGSGAPLFNQGEQFGISLHLIF
jgi:hypothetical protein